MDLETALVAAGKERLRPILMTTFALVAGMMPVAVGVGEGADFYRPLGISVIGGTIAATFLTLLVVPTFYDSLHRFSHLIKRSFRRGVLNPSDVQKSTSH